MKGLIFTLILWGSGLLYSTQPFYKNAGSDYGSVKGTVVLAPRQVAVGFGGDARYGRPHLKGNSSSDTPEDSVLIWLESPTVHSPDSPNSLHTLDQKNQKFNPALLPIRQHDTVRILNSDPVYHNVFSLSNTKRFDVGRRPQGEYLDVSFDKPGMVNVFCDIHSNMHAVIYVMPPNVLVWTKVKNGVPFSFNEVPPGSYRLNIYALGYNLKTLSIEVIEGETTRLSSLTLTS